MKTLLLTIKQKACPQSCTNSSSDTISYPYAVGNSTQHAAYHEDYYNINELIQPLPKQADLSCGSAHYDMSA